MRLILDEYLPRCRGILKTLEEPLADRELQQLTRKLSKIGRAIRFALGTPSQQPRDLVEEINDLFRRAGDRLFAVAPHLRNSMDDANDLHERAQAQEDQLQKHSDR